MNNDTYLKVFQNNLYSFESDIMPDNKDTMVSNVNFDLNHQNYDFSTNFQIFEEFGKKIVIDINIFYLHIVFQNL